MRLSPRRLALVAGLVALLVLAVLMRRERRAVIVALRAMDDGSALVLSRGPDGLSLARIDATLDATWEVPVRGVAVEEPVVLVGAGVAAVRLVVDGEQRLVGLDLSSGREAWQTRLGAASGRTVQGLWAHGELALALVGDGGEELVAVDLGTGAQRWRHRFETRRPARRPLPGEGKLAVVDSLEAVLLDPATGEGKRYAIRGGACRVGSELAALRDDGLVGLSLVTGEERLISSRVALGDRSLAPLDAVVARCGDYSGSIVAEVDTPSPVLVRWDPATGASLWSVELPGVLTGIRQEGLSFLHPDAVPFGDHMQRYVPFVVLAGGDAPALVVVDLEQGHIGSAGWMPGVGVAVVRHGDLYYVTERRVRVVALRGDTGAVAGAIDVPEASADLSPSHFGGGEPLDQRHGGRGRTALRRGGGRRRHPRRACAGRAARPGRGRPGAQRDAGGEGE